MANDFKDFLESFSKLENGCWEWEGVTNLGGYGIFACSSTTILAHRFSYEFHKEGLIPKGMFVCHTCDNPPCVNPDHLFLGSAKDNVQDMVGKGRSRTRVLTNEQKIAIINSLKNRHFNRSGRIIYLAWKYKVTASTIIAVIARK